jgi:hypothetical protein
MEQQEIEVKNDFVQLVVWEATVLGKHTPKDFEDFFLSQQNVRVKFMEKVETLPAPGVSHTGGRRDLFFYVHNDDLGHFAVARLTLGEARWWEDVLGNGNGVLYPKEILDKYPNTW